MKKLIVASSLVGAATAVGGTIFLFVKNYNIVSIDTWEMATRGYLTTPGTMISAAFSGADADLFRGLGAIAAGAVLIAAPIVGVTIWIVVQRSIQTLSFGARVRGKRGVAHSVDRKPKGILTKLKERKSDPEVDLESGAHSSNSTEEPSWLRQQVTVLVERLLRELARLKPRSKPTPTIVKRVEKKTQVDATPSSSSVDFYPLLDEWYRRVRSSGGRDFSMIERARELTILATPAVRNDVVDKDAMSGDLKLRMMDAWASKSDVSNSALEDRTVTTPTPDQSVFARAIEEVESDGVVSHEDAEEDDLDLEDDEMFASLDRLKDELETRLDSAVGDQDNDYEADEISDDVSEGSDAEDLNSGEELSSADESDDSAEQTLRMLVRAAYELMREAERVLDGEDEWSPELQDDEDRVAEVKALFNRLDAEALEVGGARIIQIVEDDEAPEWDWFGSIISDLDAERDRLLSMADPEFTDPSDEGVSETSSDPEGDIDEGDEVDGKPEGQDTAPEEISDEEVEDIGEEEGEALSETDADDEPVVSDVEVTSDGDDEPQGEVSPESVDVDDEVNDRGDTDASGEVDEEEAPVSVDASDIADAVEEDDATSTALDVEAEHKPSNLAIAELDEIARCDDLLMRWGIEAKSAGANEAKLVHAVVKKDDKLRRRVIGIVHMAATWRTEANVERGRLNLIFRYVPAGIWRIESNDGIRMVNERGDYVGVDDELLEQPEIANSTTVVHFYGPGAPSGLMEKDGKKICVVSRILSAEEIRGITLP